MADHCARKGEKGAGPCWGEVARYAFDIDLPQLNLCKGHVWSMYEGAPDYVKHAVADEMEGLSD